MIINKLPGKEMNNQCKICNKKWSVIVLTDSNVLGIEVDGSVGSSMYEYNVLETHDTDIQAYERMKDLAKEKGMYGMRYKHLEEKLQVVS